MENYIDKIMTNHVYESSESSDIGYLFSEDLEKVDRIEKMNKMKGGKQEKIEETEPTGGFPPIYIIDKKTEQVIEQTKNRELSTIKSAISIKDILSKKK
jgi:hypothetical protein